MKIENKILAVRNQFMIRLLGVLLLCVVLQNSVFAGEHAKAPKGVELQGKHKPDCNKFACLYNNAGQVLTIGENVLFPNQISLKGITYDNTLGLFTLPP